MERLATRNVSLMETALSRTPDKPSTTTWATYTRCHDDIGWTVDDADARETGLDPVAHRRFLSDFYSGKFLDPSPVVWSSKTTRLPATVELVAP